MFQIRGFFFFFEGYNSSKLKAGSRQFSRLVVDRSFPYQGALRVIDGDRTQEGFT